LGLVEINPRKLRPGDYFSRKFRLGDIVYSKKKKKKKKASEDSQPVAGRPD